MHRIDTPTAAPGGLWTGGNPQGGVPATRGSAEWFNDTVQEELANVVEGQGITLDKTRNDQLLEAIARMLGGREHWANELINGDFLIWQRGLSFAPSTTLIYGPDRWFLRADSGGGAGAATVTRQIHPLGQTDVPGRPVYYARWVQSVAATVSAPRIGQRIESVDPYWGRTITISFWAKSDTQIQNSLQVEQNFGSGGSTSTNLLSATWTSTNIWERHVFTLAVPSYASQTVGAGDYLEVRIEMPQAATYQLDLADLLVQFGDYATPYPRTGISIEAYRCQRYYEKSYPLDQTPGVAGAGGWSSANEDASPGVEGINVRYRVEKRVMPTITWYSPLTGASGQIDVNGADQPVASTTGLSTSTTGFPNLGAGTGTGKIVKAHWAVSAEL